MFQLRILGPLQVSSSDGRDAEAIVRQSKRAALLAYLAAATPRGPHRRDKLLALFWPESDELHARQALNQALYVLRAALGEEAIPPRGDGAVAINDRVIWCDAVAFEAALDEGRPAEAVAIYRGDLLDGFFVSGAPEFERWLEQERDRLRQRASDGAWAVAEAKAAEGDALEAARWARRAADLLPADEAAVRRLMTFLHRLGDRTAAIRAYEAFAWRLTQEYELEPSAETKALAATIRETQERAPDSRPVMLPAPPLPIPVAAAQRRRPVRRVVTSAVAATGLAMVGWAALRQPEPSPRTVARFALEFGGVPPLAGGIAGPTLALSPDGAQLVYLGEGEQGPQLFLRPLDRLEAIPIPLTRGATQPFFSPDGEWLGFVAENTMRKAPVAGGPPVTVCNVNATVQGASWGSGDIIVFATRAGLWQVRAAGGESKMLAAADTARGVLYRWPEVLPSGRAAVFTQVDHAGFRLAVVSLQTGAVELLGLEGTNPRFVAPGYLVFARMDGALLAVPFDMRTLRPTGTPVPIAGGLLVGSAGAAKLGVSRTGALVYVPDLPDGPLVIVSRAGHADTVPVARQGFAGAHFSPDGRQVATSIKPLGGQQDIWVLDLVANTLRRVTFDSGSVGPRWTPDGRRIVFATQPGGRGVGFAIRWVPADASEPAETLLPAEARQLPEAFTPDGRSLLFQRWSPDTRGDLWLFPLDGDRTPKPYLRGPADERSAVLSPDGRWVAYVSDESGRDEVYARPFPEAAPPVQISIGGGREPRWAPSGRELFYRSKEGMMAAAVRAASPLRVDSRKVLFDDRPYVSWRIGPAYDVHPDGDRFIMIRRGSEGRDLIVVLNWFEQQRSGRPSSARE